MATKKKTFDAVREARCWRRLAGKRQAAMTPTEYREYLRRVTEEFLTRKPLPKALAMLRRPIASAPAKKKTFDAVKESRRWKRAAARRLDKMTFPERQAHLKRVTEEFFARKPMSMRQIAALPLL
jgi:hypothetical protein